MLYEVITMSISGGVFNAIGEALDLGIETFQIFLKNSNRWESPPLKEKDIEKFIFIEYIVQYYKLSVIKIYEYYFLNFFFHGLQFYYRPNFCY